MTNVGLQLHVLFLKLFVLLLQLVTLLPAGCKLLGNNKQLVLGFMQLRVELRRTKLGSLLLLLAVTS